ncbi:MAG: response regulator [Myxococcales bacterium FL481]|nr:MAG: response regulator [Myxococcales bacterium FL481]
MLGPIAVVVLDADPAARAFLRDAAEDAGAAGDRRVSVFEAEDGAEAARLIARQNPALVIGEVLVDKLSGLALLRQIQRHRAPERRPAFVFVTQMDTDADRAWGLRCGASAYFGKPCDRAALIRALRDGLLAVTGGSNSGSS